MLSKQRLKEAIWRIQGLSRQGRISQRRLKVIDAELELLADHLGVPMLDKGTSNQ